jgi:hypothetical protein
MTTVHDLLFSVLCARLLRTLLQELRNVLRQFPTWNIGGEYLLLARKSIYGLGDFPRAIACLFEFYRSCYLDMCQETDGQDCNKADCRRNGIQVNRQVFHHNLSRMLLYAIETVFRSFRLDHTPSAYSDQSIANNLLGRAYRPSPKTAQLPLQYNVFAYQTPFLVCQTPNVTSVAGNSINLIIT